jgi:hypothetical protein
MLGFLESQKKVESNLRTIQQDNSSKIKISISNEDLEHEVRQITNWRKNILERFFSLGSSDFDKIIVKISNKVY